jgi:hypothetical protein
MLDRPAEERANESAPYEKNQQWPPRFRELRPIEELLEKEC